MPPSGCAPPGTTYQWYFNVTNALGDATNCYVDLPNVQPVQLGAYTVVVTNLYGAVTSAPAMLSVIAPVARRNVPALNLTGDLGAFLRLSGFTRPLRSRPRLPAHSPTPLAKSSNALHDGSGITVTDTSSIRE